MLIGNITLTIVLILMTKCSCQDDSFYIDLTIESDSNLVEKLNQLVVSDKIDQKNDNVNKSAQFEQILSSVWSKFSKIFPDQKLGYIILSCFIILLLSIIAVLLIFNYLKSRKAKNLLKVEFKKKKNFSFDVIDLMGYRNSFKIFKWSNADESNSISDEYQFENFSSNNSRPDQASDAISDRLIYEVPYQYTYRDKSFNAGEYELKFQTFSTRKDPSFKNECKRNKIVQEAKAPIPRLNENSSPENPYSPVLSTDSTNDDSELVVNVLSTFQSPKNLTIYDEPTNFNSKTNNF
ncbi:hypothetical protein BpHYR1_014010 [Brachionus plicatilis]|uniref:Uncharacterized protein n=1 Tax=Brachionus plicatilis TaxID=10195 RepID=A0A3M7QU19_BRAPC|nr:hypothetical protein BpHYR1_014010 [Brachionus plicatilis]